MLHLKSVRLSFDSRKDFTKDFTKASQAHALRQLPSGSWSPSGAKAAGAREPCDAREPFGTKGFNCAEACRFGQETSLRMKTPYKDLSIKVIKHP